MNIRELVKSTLEHKEILDLLGDKNIYFLKANKPKKPYVEFFIFDEEGEFWAEGKELSTTYYVQIDIFSDKSYSLIESKVKEKMLNAGFARSLSADLYEDDTKLYHKAMRFFITLNNN